MGPAAGPLNRVGKSGATPTATVRSKDKACGGCNAEKPGSPQTPPRPGKWLVNSRRTKRTYKLLCDLPFKHDGVRGRADGRVARAEARSTISPRVTAQVGENSSRTEIREESNPRRSKSSESAYQAGLVSLCAGARLETFSARLIWLDSVDGVRKK